MTGAPLAPSTLVIATRNRPDLLRACVESILAGEEVPTELIIIDQSDERAESLETLGSRCRIRHLAGPRGLSRSRNAGLAAASHDVVAFIDDDMIVPPTWFGTLVRALGEAGPRAVVTGRVLTLPPERLGAFAPAVVVREQSAVYEGRIEADVLAGGNMAMTKAIAAEVGGFDERLGPGSRFPAAEDNDLGFRLLEANHRIHYSADAMLYHRAWRPGWHYWLVRWRYGRGKGGFYGKYLSWRDRFMLRRMLRDIGSRVLRWPVLILRQPLRASGDPFYVLGVLAGILEWHLRPQGRRMESRWKA